MNVLPFLLLESAANIHGAEKKSVSVNEEISVTIHAYAQVKQLYLAAAA